MWRSVDVTSITTQSWIYSYFFADSPLYLCANFTREQSPSLAVLTKRLTPLLAQRMLRFVFTLLLACHGTLGQPSNTLIIQGLEAPVSEPFNNLQVRCDLLRCRYLRLSNRRNPFEIQLRARRFQQIVFMHLNWFYPHSGWWHQICLPTEPR